MFSGGWGARPLLPPIHRRTQDGLSSPVGSLLGLQSRCGAGGPRQQPRRRLAAALLSRGAPWWQRGGVPRGEHGALRLGSAHRRSVSGDAITFAHPRENGRGTPSDSTQSSRSRRSRAAVRSPPAGRPVHRRSVLGSADCAQILRAISPESECPPLGACSAGPTPSAVLGTGAVLRRGVVGPTCGIAINWVRLRESAPGTRADSRRASRSQLNPAAVRSPRAGRPVR